MNADGSALQALPNSRDGASGWAPAWSPDGNTANTTDQRQLTFLERQYTSVSSWSPDGQQIVFASQMGDALSTASYFDPSSSSIYVINVDGTGLHKLTENGISDSGPDWSPDGSQIRLTITSVCCEQEDEISILHSAGSLGTTIFKRDDKGWQLTQPFKRDLYGVTSHTPLLLQFDPETWTTITIP